MGQLYKNICKTHTHTRILVHAREKHVQTAHTMFTLTSSTVLARPAAKLTRTTRKHFVIAPRAMHSGAAQMAPLAPKQNEIREVAQISAKAAPPPPPARLITATQYITAFSVIMGVYTLQMLLVPAKMITDHFNAEADQMTQFWIRGASCGFAAAVWAARQMDVATGAKFAFLLSFACGILYPWNAKWNLFKNNLDLKYPMHYVPEVLMMLLTAAGAYVVYM